LSLKAETHFFCAPGHNVTRGFFPLSAVEELVGTTSEGAAQVWAWGNSKRRR